MGTYDMNPGAVSQSGNKFQQFAEDYAQEMKNLSNAINELGNSWKGAEYDLFLSDYEECNRGLSQMQTAFRELGEVLVGAADTTNAAKDDIASQISRQG